MGPTKVHPLSEVPSDPATCRSRCWRRWISPASWYLRVSLSLTVTPLFLFRTLSYYPCLPHIAPRYKHLFFLCATVNMVGARGRRRRRRTSREPEPSVLRFYQSPLRVCAGTSVWICFDRVTLDIFPLWTRKRRLRTIDRVANQRPGWRRGHADAWTRRTRIDGSVSRLSIYRVHAENWPGNVAPLRCRLYYVWNCLGKSAPNRSEISFH